MKVVSYLQVLPKKNLLAEGIKPSEKIDTIRKFVIGVNATGDQGVVAEHMNLQPADVAVMLGWVHENGKSAPHLQFRKNIIDYQRANGGRTIIADSNLFLYKNTKNPQHYLRYSYDGVFPSTGDYCDQSPDPTRWQQISQNLGISLQPYRTNGSHILLCLQRNGGWSMGGFDVVTWAINTIRSIRQYSTRAILIRPHPGDKGGASDCQKIMMQCRQYRLDNVQLAAPTTSLIDNFHNCWAVVNHNSSPGVAAAIEGFPVFVTDPVNSQCRDIANTDLSLIETPHFPDRQRWVERISQFHWSHEDIQNGACWRHMRQRAIR